MKKSLLLMFSFVLVSVGTAKAQDADTLSNKGALTISGYVDTYYQYNFNKPYNNVNTGRVFDLPHNSFSLGLVQTVFTYSVDRLNVVADLTFGPNADLGNFGNDGTSRIIKQAYISYDFTDQLTFTVGQYGTHIGYELIDAPLNYNYSLSYLFGNGPFYHTGAKLDYAVGDHFGLMVGVVNGWDALMDFNDKKSVTAQVSLAPVEGFNVYLNWIGGDEYGGASAFGDTEGSFTSLFDLTTSFQATQSFLIGVNAAYGSFSSGYAHPEADNAYSEDATWGGGAIYLNLDVNEMLGFGVRGEYFSDPNGIRYPGVPLAVTALTLTANIKLANERFLIKPEFRFDTAEQEFFFTDNPAKLSKSQTTLGAAFIYSF